MRMRNVGAEQRLRQEMFYSSVMTVSPVVRERFTESTWVMKWARPVSERLAYLDEAAALDLAASERRLAKMAAESLRLWGDL